MNKSNYVITILVFFFTSSFVFGQITESTLNGSITDTLGNVIVSSAVAAQSESTGKTFTTTTNDSGEFVFASLPSGSYTVFVRVPGFKTYQLKNLKLNVGLTSELTVKLEIGDIVIDRDSFMVHREGNKIVLAIFIEVGY